MIIQSFSQALKALFSFRTWFVVLWPPLFTGFLLSILFFVYWNPLAVSVTNSFSESSVLQWVGSLIGEPQTVTAIFASAFLILVFIPVLFVSVILVTSVFVTPLVQREVALKYFKDLEKKKGGSTLGSLVNSLKALAVFVYDVLQDFASEEERRIINQTQAPGLWGVGAILVLLAYIPFAFILLPVFSAFVYSFYGLNCLARLRVAFKGDLGYDAKHE